MYLRIHNVEWCLLFCIISAYFNVRINAKDIKDRDFADNILSKAATIYEKTCALENEMIQLIDRKI